MQKRPVKFIPVIVLLYLCTLLPVHAGTLPDGIIKPPPFKVPPINVTDIDGSPFNNKDYKGKWLFVHFWASWCRPCRREVPAIQKMWNTLDSKDIALAFINTAEDEDTIFTFLAIHAPELRALMDRDGLVTEQWHPRGLPATYLVDPEGWVRYQALGGRPWDTPEYLSFLRQLNKEQ